jgi:hypothetical protein
VPLQPQFYGVPTSPGKSRIFAGFVSNMKLPPLVAQLSGRFQWVFHLGQQVVLDSDAYLLHVQVRVCACCACVRVCV